MPDLPAPFASVYDRMTTREEVIAGCRALADLLEANPSLPHPSFLGFDLYVGRDYSAPADAPDTRRERVAELLRALPGTFTRHEREDGHMTWQGRLGGILTTIRTEREAVCERVVLGVETVEVPATEAVVIPAKPARTEEREVVEWRCAPVLTTSEDGAAVARIADAIRGDEPAEPGPNASCGRCGQPKIDHENAEPWTASCRERGGFRPMDSAAESLPGTVVP